MKAQEILTVLKAVLKSPFLPFGVPMIRLLPTAAILIAFASVVSCNARREDSQHDSKTSAAAISEVDSEEALKEIERDWDLAALAQDSSTLGRLLDDRWVAITSDGRRVDKKQYLSAFESGALQFSSLSNEDMSVNLFGNTGIVTGKGVFAGTFSGQEEEGHEWFTDIFVKRDGKWRCVSSHTSNVQLNTVKTGR